jgi:indolepyruvate ferredoxin oxidoreductase alpha subunit
VIVDNGYSAATGGQDNLSSAAKLPNRNTGASIERAARGVGVEWTRILRRTYDVSRMRDTLRAFVIRRLQQWASARRPLRAF